MAYDNLCKRLAADYPSAFVHWLLAVEAVDIEKLPTELSKEPIRADALYFLPEFGQILHIEFQTEPQSNPPLPVRMLDYFVRLYREYGCAVEQVVIFLKPTNSEFAYVEQFAVGNTLHRYRVIRLWEQDPEPLLTNPGLLPLAVLARTASPTALLEQVASRVDMIEEPIQQRDISACAEILASLKFDQNFVRQFLREDFMRESAIYQEIFKEGESSIVLRLLARKVGQISPETRSQIQQLPLAQLEELGEAMLNFASAQDLTDWLQAH